MVLCRVVRVLGVVCSIRSCLSGENEFLSIWSRSLSSTFRKRMTSEMRLRLRCAEGMKTFSAPGYSTVFELLTKIEELSGVPIPTQDCEWRGSTRRR